MTARAARAILLVMTCVSLGAQEKAPQIETIRSDEMRADLFFLAGDGMRGRLTGTPENALAGEFVKSRFERLGLKPAANGSFYQPYHLLTATLGGDNTLDVTYGPAGHDRYRAGQDFHPHRFSGSGRASGPLVYVGFGISAPQLGYNDYGDGSAVRGKVVLALDHEPGERDPASPFDGVVTADAANALRKAAFAQDHGAIGILFVDDVHNHPEPPNFDAAARSYWPPEPPRIERFMLASWVERIRIPAAQISRPAAEALVRGAGRSLADLSKQAESSRGIAPVPIPGRQVDLTVSVDRHVLPDLNVVGYIEGSDPALKDELVIVCAHFDHNGADGSQIFNGADDDGSGTVGLMEIAEAWALAVKAGQRPRRSVLFAAWNSEERGLLGAWAYTERPLWPLDQTVAVLNMDMIGRNEEVPVGGGNRFRGLDLQTAESNRNAVNVIGTARSASMKAETEKANAGIGLDLRFRYDNNISNLMRRSDHWPFLQRGVPGLWFHTGLHPDYHTVYDRPEKINYEKMEKVARLVYQMSWTLAMQDGRPRLDRAVTSSADRP
jgi:hypothetical protein